MQAEDLFNKAESDPRGLLFGTVEWQENIRQFLLRYTSAVITDLHHNAGIGFECTQAQPGLIP